MKKPPTKAESKHMGLVAMLGCLRCGAAAEIHHITIGMNTRNHLKVLPLCPYHHRQGKFGDCIHNGRNSTLKNWGVTEQEMLDVVEQKIKELQNGKL